MDAWTSKDLVEKAAAVLKLSNSDEADSPIMTVLMSAGCMTDRKKLYAHSWARQLRGMFPLRFVIADLNQFHVVTVSDAVSSVRDVVADISLDQFMSVPQWILIDEECPELQWLLRVCRLANVPVIKPAAVDSLRSTATAFTWNKDLRLGLRNLIRALSANQELVERVLLKQRRLEAASIGLRKYSTSGDSPLLSIVICTNRPDQISVVLDNVSRQSVRGAQVIVGLHGIQVPENSLKEFETKYGIGLDVKELPASLSLGRALNILTSVAKGSYIFRMDDDDFYGKFYIEDLLNELIISGAALAGKSNFYVYLESEELTALLKDSNRSSKSIFLAGPTFAGPRETFEQIQFADRSKGEDSDFLERVSSSGRSITSSDPYNFTLIRRANTESHTHRATSLGYLSLGEFRYVGFPRAQIEI